MSMEKIAVNIQRILKDFDDVPLPIYETTGSAGMDIRAAVEEKSILKGGKVAMVPTNLRVEIPEGYEIQVRPRSGLAAKNGIGVLNSPGTIDPDYRGEVKVILFNFSENDFVINRSDRIAQLIISKVYQMDLIETNTLSESDRGEGGFGHTGKS